MKRIFMFTFVLTGVVVFTGCVPMTYTKSVIVHRDASGTITGTDEIETICEQHSEGAKIKSVEGPLQFKDLK